MADKGIIFSTPMVRALLDGRKTQTRRLIKPTKKDWGPGQLLITEGPRFGGTGYRFIEPYTPGDRLYVRESFGSKIWDDPRCKDGRKPEPGDPVMFMADPENAHWGAGLPSQGGFVWRPSIHMPRWASRLWLAVTDVRVQRLQDISEADAIAEGLEWVVPGKWAVDRTLPIIGDDPRAVYSELWNSLHTKPGETWADNPWIVSVTFDVHHGNIDQ